MSSADLRESRIPGFILGGKGPVVPIANRDFAALARHRFAA